LRQSHDDEGYAAMTAIILCAALSVICAGVLALSHQERRRAARALDALQTHEALNSALVRFSAQIQAPGAGDRLMSSTGDIKLLAENEAVKWPMEKLDEITPVALAHRTRAVTVEDLHAVARGRIEARLKRPVNDCFRRLLSPFGTASPTDDRPRGEEAGLLRQAMRDGQVWRLRAAGKGRVREQLVRFTGDPARPYAVVADEEYPLAEMPECAF
jgi:hypothetical protein